MADIFIVSGFLGAGKTTLLQKLIKEELGRKKTVLVENDFGDVSVDAVLMQGCKIEVKEMNAGCICCSLSGDFVKAVKDLLKRFSPDIILVEPSGVGRLSDIEKACADPKIRNHVQVKRKITVVDAGRCPMYLENFREFYEDQIQCADTILFSHVEEGEQKVQEACRLVGALNPHARIFKEPWEKIPAGRILRAAGGDSQCAPDTGGLPSVCTCTHCHETRNGGHDARGQKAIYSAQAFDTVTLRTEKIFCVPELQGRIRRMEQELRGKVIRMKGIVRTYGGYVNVQYVPGKTEITSCSSSGDMLCVIGRGLCRDELESLFSGE